jgi:hypothetical protein
MLDALTSLAFSVQSSKGIYALLLGSGLSTAAGIPTGWDVTLDLIRKIAAADGKECGADTAAWYTSTYGRNADYSELLDSLAKTPADRTNLLCGYFESTTRDLEEGLKSPTAAHKSIAKLVAKGYFRVLVTTNFDRLLERALEEQGVSPTVISTADAARGALPLAHARCTLIKVNGDYRDTRIKNTAAELDSYDPEMDRVLDQIFDNYGLIICGWSATWDKALCSAILRCPNRRFATYWARRSGLSDEALGLVNHRQAIELQIESADVFLGALETKVDAIERYSEPHPASAKLAIASLKKFISENRYRIQLRDLVTSETESLFKGLAPLPVTVAGLTVQQIFERMKVYESTSETLIALFCHGCFWGGAEHRELWGSIIARAAQLKTAAGGMTHLLSLRLYPACLLFYASGLGALAGNKYETLAAICRGTTVRLGGEEKALNSAVLPWSVLDVQVAQQLPGYERRHTPISDRLFDVLRDRVRDYYPDDSVYQEAFDRFEYLTALIELDLRTSNGHLPHAPVGRFGWRRHIHMDIVDKVSKEAAAAGDQWPVVTAKVFPSMDRFRRVETLYFENILQNLQWY